MRVSTADAHREAERSGIVHDLLTGQTQRDGLALLLCNLLPVYQALEAGLERQTTSASLGSFAWRPLYRTSALQADLQTLGGTPVMLPESLVYADYVAKDEPTLLAGIYVRYMGDLSGGQILNRLFGRTVCLPPLAFYSFPDIADIDAFRTITRAAIDRAGALLGDTAPVVAAAVALFRLDIQLSIAVSQHAQKLSNQMLGEKSERALLR